MGLRLLGNGESAQALRQPLWKMGTDIDPKALDAMVHDAQGYPHFLQAWGHAACNELLKEWPSGGRKVTPTHVDDAMPAMDLEHAELHASRRNELQCPRGSPLRKPPGTCADIAAAILSADGQRLNPGSVEAIVEDALADEMGEAAFSADHVGAVIQRGELTGFIRRDPLTDEFHPGIPSLLSHIAKVGATPPLRRPTKEFSGRTSRRRSRTAIQNGINGFGRCFSSLNRRPRRTGTEEGPRRAGAWPQGGAAIRDPGRPTMRTPSRQRAAFATAS